MKRFFPILGAQVSSGMILPFEQFPDATADYKSTATPPVDTLFLTPDEAMGLPLANLKEKKIHSPSGKLMLILSPNEHAWFRRQTCPLPLRSFQRQKTAGRHLFPRRHAPHHSQRECRHHLRRGSLCLKKSSRPIHRQNRRSALHHQI